MPSMRTISFAALAFALLSAAPALAQDDSAPIPYDDGESQPTPPPSNSGGDTSLPYQSDSTRQRPEETQVERADRDLQLAKYDDPSVGVGGQLVAGAMMLDASRGSG